MKAQIKSRLKTLPIVLLAVLLSGCSWNARSDSTCKAYDSTVARRTILAADLSKRVAGRFLIIAHRGYSSKYPENSIDASREAIVAGADLIETDLRESAEGAIVLSHDYAGADTLKKLTEQGIMPFPVLLKLAKNRIGLLLDMKEGSPPFLRKVIDVVNQHGMLNQVIFGVRDIDQTRELRKLSPTAVILGFLSRTRYDFDDFYEAGGHIGRIWEADLDPSTIKDARGDGTRPIWITPRIRPAPTGDIDESRLKDLMKNGFDGVLVNDPVLALATRCSVLETPND